MHARRVRPLVAAVVAQSFLVVACGGERAPSADSTTVQPPAPAATSTDTAAAAGGSNAQLIALGDSVFHGLIPTGICYTCHGPDAKGTPLAPDLTDATWLNGDGSLEFITSTVRTGVPQPKQHAAPMPPFGETLTPQQISGVAAYVYSLSHR